MKIVFFIIIHGVCYSKAQPWVESFVGYKTASTPTHKQPKLFASFRSKLCPNPPPNRRRLASTHNAIFHRPTCIGTSASVCYSGHESAEGKEADTLHAEIYRVCRSLQPCSLSLSLSLIRFAPPHDFPVINSMYKRRRMVTQATQQHIQHSTRKHIVTCGRKLFSDNCVTYTRNRLRKGQNGCNFILPL